SSSQAVRTKVTPHKGPGQGKRVRELEKEAPQKRAKHTSATPVLALPSRRQGEGSSQAPQPRGPRKFGEDPTLEDLVTCEKVSRDIFFKRDEEVLEGECEGSMYQMALQSALKVSVILFVSG